ncbi:peroxidasin [Hyalella azteca]|uniref:Peroxidasin n=1 Tax=Hyalella azteca TaxID=294128 RepID=A0A979FLY3_HYAAZ|nr:peroxidasin [Hyalella azteca]
MLVTKSSACVAVLTLSVFFTAVKSQSIAAPAGSRVPAPRGELGRRPSDPQEVTAVGVPCPSKCLCFRTTVRCMFVQLTAIPVVSPETTILDLRFNKIRSIPPGSFRQLARLNTLLLNNNHITRLQSGAFDGLQRLRYLYLYKNRIRHIDRDVFHNLEELEQLYLHFNDITSFDAETFSSLPSLQRLFLHNNRLQRVPSGAFRNLQSLRRLRLDSNALVCDCQLLWLAQMVKEKQDRTLVAATCEAPNDLHGKSLSSITDTDFHCIGMPHIMEGPQDIEVSFGGTAAFTCKVDGDPVPEVVWLHNNEVIGEARPRYSVLNDGTLMIKNAQGGDAGFYECRAINEMGEVASRPAKISMTHQYRDNSPPVIIEEPQNLNATLGQRVELPCNVTGYPEPDVVWSKEGGFLQLSETTLVHVNNSLVFSSVQEHHQGVYTCQARNPLGQATAAAALRVTAPVRLTTAPVDQTVTLGHVAHFTCEAQGLPEPDVKWLRHGLVIAPSAGISIAIGGAALRVLQVQKADEGLYTCRADNGQTSAQSSAMLFVRESLPPVIMERPADQTAVAGAAEVRLRCAADGLPPPTVVWRKDGYLMSDSRHYRVERDGSLLVYNVSAGDAGDYECSAENALGRASARAALTVAESPDLGGVGDEFFRESFLEANAKVNRALNMTLHQLFDRDRPRQPLPHELLRLFRFPQTEAREIARAAEKVEQTLAIVHRHVEAGMQFNLTKFSYQDLLSPENLELLTNLSGCLGHRRTVSCNDMCFHLKYRTIDGTCNNLDNPTWGSSLTGFRRILPPIYENGFNSPVGWSKTKVYYGYFKPGPRLVSTRIMSNEAAAADDQCTHMLMQWGQFLDHDLDHALPSISTGSFIDGVECDRSCAYSAPCFPIEIPYDDPRVYRHRCMEFTRSSAVCGSGMTSVFFNTVQPREQINQLTSFIDASQVYGSSYGDTQNLRNFSENLGDLRIGISMPSGKPLMPFSAGAPIDCRRDTTESAIDCFLAGDVRANEQTALLAMHTVWFREHNRMAAELREINPHWDGDTVFHETRKILGAMMQHITYQHWLPHIIGPHHMQKLGRYSRYDTKLDPSISNVFATAALRFGHTLVNPVLERLNASFQPTRHGALPLHKAFFSPWRLVQEGGVDPLLRGLLATPVKLKRPGQFLNTELTEKLFQAAHEIALDLAAMNIQRGRDHALPGESRHFTDCQLPAAASFEDLRDVISDDDVREKLHELYGHPGNVDVWVGALLEDPVPGGRVGPLLACLLLEQFRRLRDGDRFWYEHPSVFKPEQLDQIRRTTLGRVLCDNGDDIKDVTSDVFLLPHLQTPAFVSCTQLPRIDLRFWAECCKDCRNAGYFNSLIRTPGLRLRRSLDDQSYVEEREDLRRSLHRSPYETTFPEDNFSTFESPISNASNSATIDRSIDVHHELFRDLKRNQNLEYGTKGLDQLLSTGKENNEKVELYQQFGFQTLQDKKSKLDLGKHSSFNKNRHDHHDAAITFTPHDPPLTAFNRPLNLANLVLPSDAVEERIEGVEAVVEKLSRSVQQLVLKIERLEQALSENNRPPHARTCVDGAGATRHLKETWYQDPCTKCVCRKRGMMCKVVSCNTALELSPSSAPRVTAPSRFPFV